MIISDNGRCMLEGSTIELLVEFANTIGSIKGMLEKHMDNEHALMVIAECGRVGIGLTNGGSLDVGEFAKSLDAIRSDDVDGMVN